MRVAQRIVAVAVVLVLLVFHAANAPAQDLYHVIQNWLRCTVVDGHIAVDGTRLAGMGAFTDTTRRKETLSIRSENGQMVLHYEQPGDEAQLVITISASGDHIFLRRAPRGQAKFPAAEFEQLDSQKITFSLGSGPEQQVFRGHNLWHLLIARPKECREHLLPLLDMLRPNWSLAETAAQVEEKLLREAKGDGASRRARWSALVAQLADDNFSKREAADRALRGGDTAAMAYLRQLDFGRLDAEQQFRIRRIVDSHSAQSEDDSVEQAAATLAGDPAVWLVFLARPELAPRQTAARELTGLLGGPITVDPAAPPETQKDRREQLRVRIEGQK